MSSLVLCINVNCFSEDKASWRLCLFLGETQGRERLGRNRSISLVRRPSEEVVILKRSQVRWLCSVTELGKQEAGASLRCREQQGHVSSRDVRTRASISAASKWLFSDDRTFKASYYISTQGSPIQP